VLPTINHTVNIWLEASSALSRMKIMPFDQIAMNFCEAYNKPEFFGTPRTERSSGFKKIVIYFINCMVFSFLFFQSEIQPTFWMSDPFEKQQLKK